MRREHDSEAFRAEDRTRQMLVREARDGANRWLARFAPLLDDREHSSADECRRRLDLIDELRTEGDPALSTLEARAEGEDAALLTTLRDAVGQIDGLEADLKRRLGLLAPGDPEGLVDLDALRARLAEAAARRELGAPPLLGTAAPARLDLPLSAPNWAAGGFMGIFSLGWLSFTTFHAFLMIGGIASTGIGWGALALLPFYGIFWAVGLGMAATALQSASSESLTLEGDTLVVRRRLGPWTRERRTTLGPDSRAYLTSPGVFASRSGPDRAAVAPEIAVQDAQGREVRFGRGCPPHQQEQVIARLNQHLGVRGGGRLRAS